MMFSDDGANMGVSDAPATDAPDMDAPTDPVEAPAEVPTEAPAEGGEATPADEAPIV
jgi:hypothetical protein